MPVEARFGKDGDREGPDPSTVVRGAEECGVVSWGKETPVDAHLECPLGGEGTPSKEGMTKFLLGIGGQGAGASKANSPPGVNGDIREVAPPV